MTRDMIIDAIVAGAGIWGCTVARRWAVTVCKRLEKRVVGGGEEWGLIVWRGWWNDGDWVVGWYNEAWAR